jgi:hypothetical protein
MPIYTLLHGSQTLTWTAEATDWGFLHIPPKRYIPDTTRS